MNGKKKLALIFGAAAVVSAVGLAAAFAVILLDKITFA